MRPSALECARDGHETGTLAVAGTVRYRATAWKEWWAGTGLNRRHQGFQARGPGRGSARKALPRKDEAIASSCAGVRLNRPECPRDGKDLGTLEQSVR